MKNTKLLSVIVPVYNVEKYLERCVSSIQNQIYKNLEIILVDDGSPDGCPKLCDELAKKDTRIKVFHKKNGGVSSARNLGIENASGEYIAFVDSDDYLLPDYYESMMSKISDDVDVVIAGLTIINDDKEKFEYICDEDSDCKFLNSIESFFQFLHDGFIAPPVNKIYKKSIITNNFPENIPYGEDRIFNLNYLRNVNYKVVTVHNSGYIYEYNTSSASHKKQNLVYSVVRTCQCETRRFLIDTFGTFDNEGYYKLIEDMYYMIYRNSSKSEFKKLKKTIIKDVFHKDYIKYYKPKSFKRKFRRFLFKHLKIGLYDRLTKFIYKY